MYLALFSVAFGSLLTLLQAGALFHMLGLNAYVSYRAVLNTMNNFAPFLCLGFDTAAPVLRRMHPGFPFFWNLLTVHFLALILFLLTSISLPGTSKLQPLTLGLAAGTSVAAALTLANYHRTEGGIRRYFLHINVVDRIVRTAIILGLAILVHDVLLWSILMATLCFAYVGVTSRQTGVRVQVDAKIFWCHLRTSCPYIFSALGIILLTRLPFYVAYLTLGKLATAKIDFWLMVCLFLLIPVLNKSKIEEANSTGLAREYLVTMKKSWRRLLQQELMVAGGIVAVSCAAAWYGRAAKSDLVSIVLPLMLGMILIASQPNYVQVLCFFEKYLAGVKVSVVIAVVAMLAYLPKLVFTWLPIPGLFIASAVLYCALGCAIARRLNLKVGDFWRWRDALVVGACSTVVLSAAYFLIGGRT